MKKSLLAISALTLTCLYGLLVAVVILICALTDQSVLFAVIISIIVLAVQFLISPWLTDLSMRWFYKADFGSQVPGYLQDFVNAECSKYNMKAPKIGVINDGAPNAFTYGRTRNDARIIITRGIFELLDAEEVKAVVGHELGHVVHLDMLVMTVAQVVPLVLYAIYEGCMESVKKSSRKSSSKGKNSGGGLALIGLIAYIIYLICQLIILWLSRVREYYADEFSAEETGNPNALCSALVTIGYGLATTGKSDTKNRHSVASPSTLGISDSGSSKAMAVCCTDTGDDLKTDIRNAMKWDMWNIWAKYYEIGSTHPLISKRLLALSKLSPEYGQEPYITFDCVKPESFADDFLKEVLINLMPVLSLIILLITYISTQIIAFIPLILLVPITLSLLKYRYRHPVNDIHMHTVKDLIGEVKVSGVTAIPCELEGEIIGRGNPGCVFNEDFVLKDSTGIVLLDYKQPLIVINKIFALFKSKEYFGKITRVTGWYRRAPVPYVELKCFETDGLLKKCWTYQFGYIWRFILLAVGVFFTIASLL